MTIHAPLAEPSLYCPSPVPLTHYMTIFVFFALSVSVYVSSRRSSSSFLLLSMLVHSINILLRRMKKYNCNFHRRPSKCSSVSSARYSESCTARSLAHQRCPQCLKNASQPFVPSLRSANCVTTRAWSLARKPSTLQGNTERQRTCQRTCQPMHKTVTYSHRQKFDGLIVGSCWFCPKYCRYGERKATRCSCLHRPRVCSPSYSA